MQKKIVAFMKNEKIVDSAHIYKPNRIVII